MDNLGDLFGGLGDILGDMFGGSGAGEGVMDIADFFAPDDRARREGPRAVYERYLCGGPRTLNVNDR